MAEAATGAKLRLFAVQYEIYDADTVPRPVRELVLSTPDLLLTPPAIAARRAPTTFALWSDAKSSRGWPV